MVIRPYLLAALAVLPLLAPSIWNGFSAGLAEPVLGVISAAEQPLSVRSPGALWAIALVLSWLGLAHARGAFQLWHVALVGLGTGVALVRAGNLWLLALVLLLPLGHELGSAPRLAVVVTALASIVLALATALGTRPPGLPPSAVAAVPPQATVLVDWRWAPALQRSTHANVLGANGLRAQPIEFWVDYLRVTQGHERWEEILRANGVNTLVLDTRAMPLAAELVGSSPEWRALDDTDGVLVAQHVQR